jgi:RNA polymerase sigma-70 factor (subfamily 1)
VSIDRSSHRPTGSPEVPDEELVRRTRAGDLGAVGLLFDRHLPKLRQSVRARLPVSIRARFGESDIVQEAYLSAFRSLPQFEDRGEGSFARWLRGVLEHTVADEVRRHTTVAKRDARREVNMETNGAGDVAACEQRTPSAEAASNEASDSLRATVATLTEDHRTVVRLVHDEGLTLVVAAERMNRSPDAVRKLYGRALVQLASRLDPLDSRPR